jgi:signal transduction histidine kinase
MSTARRLDSRRLWFDVGLAIVVPTVQLAVLTGRGIFLPWTSVDAVTVALVLVQGLPLAARRIRPWPVFGVVLAANSAYYALGLPTSGYDLGLAVALFTVANLRPMRASLLAYALIVAETLAMKLLSVGPYWTVAPWFLVTYLWVYFGAAWLLGRYLRVRSQQTQNLLVQVERERQESLAAAVREERTRIARELHDVIAHHLSLMVIQAGGARRLVEQEPARAKEALEVIEEYGRRGLDAMPGLLRALRTDGPEERHPTPTLGDVDTLVSGLRQTGLPVTVERHGRPRPLPDRVELSAFRIVQEALTNVVRHAGQGAARVELVYEPDRLVVSVSDDGPGPSAPRPVPSGRAGHGIAGMRERVALLGGELTAGPLPGGGFRVRAEIPCAS